MLKSIIFLVKSFLGNFYRHVAIFFLVTLNVTVLELESSHHRNVDAVGRGDSDERNESSDERGQRLDHRVQPQRRHEGTAGGSDVGSAYDK